MNTQSEFMGLLDRINLFNSKKFTSFVKISNNNANEIYGLISEGRPLPHDQDVSLTFYTVEGIVYVMLKKEDSNPLFRKHIDSLLNILPLTEDEVLKNHSYTCVLDYRNIKIVNY